MPEIIKEGINGYLVNEDVESLITASKKIDQNNPVDCRRASESFSLQQMVSNYIDYYNQVLSNV